MTGLVVLGSRAGEERGWDSAGVLCGWRWEPGHCLLWWWPAEYPQPALGLRTGEVGQRADLQLGGEALHPHRDCSLCCAGGKSGAQGPAPVCRQGLGKQVQVPWPMQGVPGPGGPWAVIPVWGPSSCPGVRGLRDSGLLGPRSWGKGQEQSGAWQ